MIASSCFRLRCFYVSLQIKLNFGEHMPCISRHTLQVSCPTTTKSDTNIVYWHWLSTPFFKECYRFSTPLSRRPQPINFEYICIGYRTGCQFPGILSPANCMVGSDLVCFSNLLSHYLPVSSAYEQNRYKKKKYFEHTTTNSLRYCNITTCNKEPVLG